MSPFRRSAPRAAFAAFCGLGLTVLAVQAAAGSVFVVPEASTAARAWSRNRDLLWLAEQAAALGLPALLLFSGLGARLRTGLDKLTRGRRLLTASLFAGVYAALFVAASLPISAARRILAEPFGLAAPSWAAWAAGEVQGAWPLLAAALLLGWAPWLLFARSPRWWPIGAAAVLLPIAGIALLTQPSWRDLQPLTDPKLKAMVSELAGRAGAPKARVVLQRIEGDDPCGEMGTVLGLGPTKVLALGTNLVRHLPEREIRAVFAHELKHYARNDDWAALGAAAALIAGGLGVVFVGSRVAMHWGWGRFGFEDLADPASLPLVVLLLTAFSLVGGAAFHRYGNHVEREADRFALELTRDNAGAAALMRRDLGCTPLRNPDTSWIQQTFRRNHPSLGDRIRFARDYRPWATERSESVAGK